MGHTNSPFPAVSESCIPIWYYIYDAWKKAPSPLQRATQTVQKLRLWQRTSLRSFSLCGCLFEFLSMPPWNLPLSHCERVLAGVDRARLWVVAPEWVSTRGPPHPHQTRMCADIWANPLISPPGLLSISDGSRAVGDDGCWQDLDYWGEDEGSSCSDRIAVTWDPWRVLLGCYESFSFQTFSNQEGTAKKERMQCSSSLLFPSRLLISLTNTHTHHVPRRGRWPPIWSFESTQPAVSDHFRRKVFIT